MDAYEQIEPAAAQLDFEAAPLMSLAISAKRIADALETIATKDRSDPKRDEAATRRDFIGMPAG